MSAPSRPLRSVIAAGVVGVALLLAACSGGAASGGPPPDSSALPRTPTALPTFDPGSFQRLLTSLRGTPVVANVWASWCGPCTKEAPDLAEAAKRYAGRVQFVGIDVLDHAAPARAFIERYGWVYPSVFDPSGAIRNDLGFLGQPDTVFYDRTGKQVKVVSGPLDRATLDEQITRILAR
jgi:cytochrome c biogenesis protein CcmG, thiol:disulfide interchange protein DsbE